MTRQENNTRSRLTYEPVAGLALGYPGNPDQLPETLHRKELALRPSKGAAEFIFTGRWG